jgi:hypothetical protein
MRQALHWAAAALALGLAGCNPGGGNEVDAAANGAASGNAAAAGNAAAPGNGAAATLCFFTPDDVKDWKAVRGKAGTRTAGMIIVTGKARVGDPRYRAQLTDRTVENGVLRLWLTHAEHDEEAPADGWWDLKYGPGESGISRVVIWCDMDTDLVDLAVE